MVNFYRRFLPNCADLMLPLTNMLSVPKGPLELTGEALTVFERIKNSLADAILLTHPAPEAQLSLMLLPAETRYSTFGRELLAIYLAVKHFRHFLEGQGFTIFTDHKPLTFAIHSRSDKLSPREIRHLDYISHFTSDIRHIDGSRNEVADALSRPSIAHLQLSPGIDLAEMAAEQRRVGSPCDGDVSGLQLQELPLTTGNGTILCGVSTPSHRPFVPPSLRRKVFSSLHNLSHPGSRATDKLVSDRFVWPGMHKDLKAWTRACLGCQRNKVTTAIPLPDVAAPTVVKAFLSRWVAIFGAPSTITTDRGAQFESNVFQSLLSFLGCTRIRTTAYHPAVNGMVERFHRQLKASLRAADDPENWTDHLPLVLLGIRSSFKSDLDCSATELVFDATVRLPGQMISPTPRVAVEDPTNLLHRLRQFLRTLSPVPPRPSVSESYLEKDLATCSHVYLRCDRVRRPLEPPYDGPFRVISRGTKNFRIQCGTREEVVSVDRLKATVPDTPPDEPCGPLPPAPPPRPSIPPSRILPLPPCPQPTTATTPSSTNNTTPPTPSAPLRAIFGLAGGGLKFRHVNRVGRFLPFAMLGRCITWFKRTQELLPDPHRFMSVHVEPGLALVENSSLPIKRVPRSKAEFLQKMLHFQHQTPADGRLLKIAVVGYPNSGKSSLVNMLTKWRTCAVSGRAHTTRSKQTVVYTTDSVQLAFVDLPGIVSLGQARQFKLEKTFFRDPHAAIFDCDLILVLVDSANKYARQALHPEIVKTLHFFKDKESILVLNKVDQAKGNPTRLLDVSRRLTRGVVSGRISHADAYENRYIHRAELAARPNAMPRLEPSEVITLRLPAAAIEAANRRLAEVAAIRQMLNPPFQVERLGEPRTPAPPTLLPHSGGASHPTLRLEGGDDSQPGELTQDLSGHQHQLNTESAEVEKSETCTLKVSCDTDAPAAPSSARTSINAPETREEVGTRAEEPEEVASGATVMPKQDRQVTDVERQSIEEYFMEYSPKPPAPVPASKENTTAVAATEDTYLDSIVEQLKQQLLLHSASKEEVELRKRRWRQLAVELQGVEHWEGFSEVFMVSSVTGEGIDKLRDYLLGRAKPGRSWVLSPALLTDQEPTELVKMCVRAHCLEKLPQEVPYALTFIVDDCERARLEGEGDDRMYVHARILCRNERQLKKVIGVGGSTIRLLAGDVKQDLMDMFQAPTTVKLTAEMAGPSRGVLRRLRRTNDASKVFPDFAKPVEPNACSSATE
ncbi:Era Like 12S Mitochondrial RRNA Chaperone 1 [Sparganum proliferum]